MIADSFQVLTSPDSFFLFPVCLCLLLHRQGPRLQGPETSRVETVLCWPLTKVLHLASQADSQLANDNTHIKTHDMTHTPFFGV